MQGFLAAVIQTASAGFDVARSIDKLAGLISEAAAKGAKLAVLPEAFIGGYPKASTSASASAAGAPEDANGFASTLRARLKCLALMRRASARSQRRTIFIL